MKEKNFATLREITVSLGLWSKSTNFHPLWMTEVSTLWNH